MENSDEYHQLYNENNENNENKANKSNMYKKPKKSNKITFSHKLINYAFFSILGAVGLAPFFAILTETDYINTIYPRYLVNIYIILPTNVAAFVTIFLNIFLSKFCINKKLLISSIIFTLATCSIFLPLNYLPNNLTGIY